MVTLREWLTIEGFNWERGRIIFQETDNDCPGWEDPKNALEIDRNHPILDYRFDSEYGGPECPRIIAEDETAIYFPGQYDGATWLERVYKDIDKYLDITNPTPYPGS